MINMNETIRQLTASAESMRALLQTIPAEQAQWKPDAETWSLTQVMRHIYNEERIDFRKHLKEMLSSPPEPWGEFRPEEIIEVEDLSKGLEGFLFEREASIAWLKGLESPDWERSFPTPWRTISAGDVLVSWVEHDFLHMRQLIELLHAWNVKQAAPFSTEYAGGW